LAKIGDALYADVDLLAGTLYLGSDSVPVHAIVRVGLAGDRLTFAPCDRARTEAVVAKDPQGIAADVQQRDMVLTSQTPALQAFFRKHGAEIVAEPMILLRRQSSPPTKQVVAGAQKLPERVEEVIWWLPADTQTLIVAQGPWQPNFEEDGHAGASACDLGLDESLQLFVSGFGRDRRGGESHVPPVAFALEGSRHFRSPKHLGEMPYEGAHLVVFQQPLGPAADTVKRWMTGGFDQSIIDAMPKIKTEKIGGYDVLKIAIIRRWAWSSHSTPARAMWRASNTSRRTRTPSRSRDRA
jgi:hypothetical protein